jgi:hypothetical protein
MHDEGESERCFSRWEALIENDLKAFFRFPFFSAVDALTHTLFECARRGKFRHKKNSSSILLYNFLYIEVSFNVEYIT